MRFAAVSVCLLCLALGLPPVAAQEAEPPAEQRPEKEDPVEVPAEAQQVPNSKSTSPSNDVDPGGVCKADIESLCGAVRLGSARLANCLRDASRAATARKQERPVSELCWASVRAFFVKVAQDGIDASSAQNVAADPVLGFRHACLSDIERYCSGMDPKKVMRCLKKAKAQLTEACREKVFQVQVHQAEDLELDVAAAEACRPDIEKWQMCNLTSPPGAQTTCLRKHRLELSDKCKTELFRREEEASSDLRLNLDVLNACQEEVASHCKGESFGEARVFSCLWQASLEKSLVSFSEDCKRRVTALAKRAGSDYRLDYAVKTACAADIDRLCGEDKQITDNMSISELFGTQDAVTGFIEGNAGRVLRCLKKEFKQLENPGCKKAMARVVQTHATMWDADMQTARSCKEDVARLCEDVQKPKVLQCLRKHSDELSQACKNDMRIQGEVEAMDVTFKPLIFNACKNAIRTFCKGVPLGEAQVIQCLQDSLDKPDFPQKCKVEVEDDLEASNHDWRLKFGVVEQCKGDVEKHCSGVDLKEGKAPVLDCLKTKLNELTAGCQPEVMRWVRSGVDDIRMAPVLNFKCMSDVAAYCSEVQPGGGRVHDCLLRHRAEISKPCAQAEFELQALKASDVRFSSVVMQACGGSIKKLCKDTGGGGMTWACLEDNLDKREVDAKCRKVVQKEMELKHSEFHLNLRLARSCEEDARKICPTELEKADFKDFSAEGQVITCLTANVSNVENTACKEHLRRKAGQRVEKVQLDPVARKSCKHDVAKFCSKAKGLPGWVQDCLKEHFENLSEPCKAAQKVYMVAASTDIRMNPALEKACGHVADKLCKNMRGGTLRCLLGFLHSSHVNQPCRELLTEEMKKRASDFDFSPKMKADCKMDLHALEKQGLCEKRPKGNWQMDCLTNSTNAQMVKDVKCKAAIASAQLRESADLRAKPGLPKVCRQDIQDLCPTAGNGAADVSACLREHVNEVKSQECKGKITEIQARDKYQASTNYDIMKRCVNELGAFCQDVEPGESRLLACLGMHQNEAGFSSGCKGSLAKTAVQDILKKPMYIQMKDSVHALMEKHRGFLDKWGVWLFVGTLGFVSVVAFALAWCCIHRRVFNMGYTAVVPRDLES